MSDLGKSEQVIIVDSSGINCSVKFFEKNKNDWNCKHSVNGFVGLNGVSDKSREGDYCTPRGIFQLGFAFGFPSLTGLNVEYRQINYNCYWVDDPDSPLYNQWIESNNITWNSAEHLADYPVAYKYSIVINYNMSPVIPYKGSAIFLHCSTGSYTAGCVSIPENDMLEILKKLDASKTPMIVIV